MKALIEPYLTLQIYPSGEKQLVLNTINNCKSKKFTVLSGDFEELIKQYEYFKSLDILGEPENDENQ